MNDFFIKCATGIHQKYNCYIISFTSEAFLKWIALTSCFRLNKLDCDICSTVYLFRCTGPNNTYKNALILCHKLYLGKYYFNCFTWVLCLTNNDECPTDLCTLQRFTRAMLGSPYMNL